MVVMMFHLSFLLADEEAYSGSVFISDDFDNGNDQNDYDIYDNGDNVDDNNDDVETLCTSADKTN